MATTSNLGLIAGLSFRKDLPHADTALWVVAGDVHVARAEVGTSIALTIRAQRVPAVAHLVVHQLPGDFLAELCRPRLLCVPRLQATGAECCLRVLNGATGRR